MNRSAVEQPDEELTGMHDEHDQADATGKNEKDQDAERKAFVYTPALLPHFSHQEDWNADEDP